MRRYLLSVTAVTAMIGVSALALPKPAPPLLNTWVGNAKAEKPAVAVLIEMGVKDPAPRDWSGKATVTGAKLVKREGYRFRKEDKLRKGGRWKASSHRAIRAPKGNPVVNKMEPIASVGVVLYLKNVKDDGTLTIDLKDQEGDAEELPLKTILAGKRHKLWNGQGVARLISTASPVATGKTEDDFPAAAYGPDGTLWVAYISYTVKEDSRRVEAPPLKEQPNDFRTFFTPEYGDQLWVKYCRGGKWSKPIAVTPPGQDLARCAIAADKHFLWVVYSAQRNGNFDLYRRGIAFRSEDDSNRLDCSLGDEERLTTGAGPDITPVMCTDQAGSTWLAWQSWGDDGQARIAVLHRDTKGTVSRTVVGSKTGENCWHPAIAADNTGKVAVAFDAYRDGDYDVGVTVFDGTISKRHDDAIATSRKAEMRPSLAYQGERLWIAYEEGPEKWGRTPARW